MWAGPQVAGCGRARKLSPGRIVRAAREAGAEAEAWGSLSGDGLCSTPATMEMALQDRYAPHNRCFGCGPANDRGLRIKTRLEDGVYISDWTPAPHHRAFGNVLSGGIAGTILDCHSNWTSAHVLMIQRGAETPPCTVTAEFSVKLRAPTPMDEPLRLTAKPVSVDGDRVIVEATLASHARVTARCRGIFVAVNEGHPAYHRW